MVSVNKLLKFKVVDKNYIYAIELLNKSVDFGNINSCLLLGFLYFNKGNISKSNEDFKQAIIYYEKGAKYVNIDCIKELGKIYKNGFGVKKSLEKVLLNLNF
jgi:TPR repeat protein